MPTNTLKRILIPLFVLTILQAFFVNCSGSGTQDNSAQSSSSARADNDINTFSKDPPLMVGEAGFQFLLDEYFSPHCGSCHDSKLSFGPAYFDVGNRRNSYEVSQLFLQKSDVIMRVTNNPFCPTCKLNAKGEVYQAIMYWLDHRK